MDIETLKFRAKIIQALRSFFIDKGFLELDTPALSRDLIPENCLEVFKTEYVEPWTDKKIPLYLVPSPEIYIKKIIGQHKTDVFQLSKCYRNVESHGDVHSPEFTMLEYYKMNADYKDTLKLTQQLFDSLLPPAPKNSPDPYAYMRPPFLQLRMDDAFEQFAGFKLSSCPEPAMLAAHAKRLGLEPGNVPFEQWPWDDLYELILVHCIEPNLPKDRPVALMDYPALVPCLAQEFEQDGFVWKERWELYCNGVEVSNCYSEETDAQKIREYFEAETKAKNACARIPHNTDPQYYRNFESFPKCSGNAMGVDRLIALLNGNKSIEGVLPFPL